MVMMIIIATRYRHEALQKLVRYNIVRHLRCKRPLRQPLARVYADVTWRPTPSYRVRSMFQAVEPQFVGIG